MITFMIGIYVHKYFSLYNRCLEIVQIDNQKMIPFVNIWSNEVPLNYSDQITVNKIYGHLDASISPTSVKIYNNKVKSNK